MKLVKHTNSTGAGGEFKPLWKLPEVSPTQRRIFGVMPPMTPIAREQRSDPDPERTCIVESIITTDDRFVVLGIYAAEGDFESFRELLDPPRQDHIVVDRRHTMLHDRLDRWFRHTSVSVSAVRARPDNVPTVYGKRSTARLIQKFPRAFDAVRIAAIGKLPPQSINEGIIWA